MTDTMTLRFPVTWYMRCDSCAHEYSTHEKDKRCPLCMSTGSVWGIRVSNVQPESPSGGSTFGSTAD